MNMHFRVPSLATGLALILLMMPLAAAGGTNPVPFVNQPLVPAAAVPGRPGFALTVNGTGFVSGATVNWNGSPRATTFVSSMQLTASILASDIATAGTASVTVVNPTPGGGVSNAVFLPITNSLLPIDFTLTSSPATGNVPESVVVGDFNGDGKLDLAVANSGSNTISILLGDGKGNFGLASSPATAEDPVALAVGDFNGDGKLDLAVAALNGQTVSILLGDGTGNFTLAFSVPVGAYATSLAVGDFNEDGNLDLAVNDYIVGEINPSYITSIFLGDGTGNFSQGVTILSAGGDPDSTSVGDFNQDGHLDLAIANYCGADVSCFPGGLPGTVSILLGDGTGNFSLAASPTVGLNPSSVVAADFNGDGKLDLAVANQCGFNPTVCTVMGNGFTLSILLGDGAGNFTLSSSPVVGSEPQALSVGDFNGDSKLDLAVADMGDNTLSILLGDGTGSFSVNSSPATGSMPYSLATGDFNGDGRLDLAVANKAGNTASILLQSTTVISPLVLSPNSLTLSPGDSGTFTATVAIGAGINAITFNCSNVPGGATCSPGTATRNPDGTLTSTITITTTAAGAVPDIPLQSPARPLLPRSLPLAIFLSGLALGVSALLAAKSQLPVWNFRRMAFAAALVLLFGGLGLLSSCGGGGSGGGGQTGTPPGTYSLVVTASAANQTVSTTFALTVK